MKSRIGVLIHPNILNFFYRIGSIIAVKNSRLGGNADIFMAIFSADGIGFAI